MTRQAAWAIGVVLALLGQGSSRAGTPPCAADECGGACPITGDGVYELNFTGATPSTFFSFCYGLGRPDVWFLFEPAATGVVTLSMCGSPGSADAAITVYPGAGCAAGGAPVAACATGGCGAQPVLTFPARAGFSYLVRVTREAAGAGPLETLAVTTEPLPVEFDLFVNPDAPLGGDGLRPSTPMLSLQEAVDFAASEAPAGSSVRIQNTAGRTRVEQTVQCGPANASVVTFALHLSGDVLNNDDFDHFSEGTRADNTATLIEITDAGATRYVFEGVEAYKSGGPAGTPGAGGHAIVVRHSDVEFRNCYFRHCWATAGGVDPDAGSGGAVLLRGVASVALIGCDFNDCRAELDGGAIAARDVGALLIRSAEPAPARRRNADSVKRGSPFAATARAGRDGGFLHATGQTAVTILEGELACGAGRDGGCVSFAPSAGAPDPTLTVIRSACSGDAEFGVGGAIAVAGGRLRLCTSILRECFAEDGAAVHLDSASIAGLDAGAIASSLIHDSYARAGGSAVTHASDGPRALTIANTILRDNWSVSDDASPIEIPSAQAGAAGPARIAFVSSNVEFLSALATLGPTPASCVDLPARLDTDAFPGLYPGDPGIDAGDPAHLCPDTFDLDQDGNTKEPEPIDYRGQPRLQDDTRAPGVGPGPRLDIGPAERADGSIARQWQGGASGVIDDPAAYYPKGPIDPSETLVVDAVPGGTTIHVPAGNASCGSLLATGNMTIQLDEARLDLFLLQTDGWGALVSPSTVTVEGPGTFAAYAAGGSAGSILSFRDLDLVAGGAVFNSGEATYRLDRCRVTSEDSFPQVSVYARVRIAGQTIIDADGLLTGSIAPADNAPYQLTVNGDASLSILMDGREFSSGGITLRVFDGSTADRIDVAGAIRLGGALSVSFEGGFEPQVGTPFSVPLITAASGSRQFALVNLPALSGGRFARILYQSRERTEAGDPESRGVGPVVALAVENLQRFLGFDDPAAFAAEGVPASAAAGDLDGDGDPDLVLATPGETPADPGSVVVLLNAGTDAGGAWLGFGGGVQVPSGGANPVVVRLGDLDGAPGLDIAVVNRTSDTVVVLRNNGDASSFTAAPPIPAGNDPRGLGVADFDGDGRDDLAVSTTTFSDGGALLFFINAGGVGDAWAGTIPGPTIPIAGGSSAPTTIEPADMDDDKDIDAIVADAFGAVHVVPNQGTAGGAWGGPGPTQTIMTGGAPTTIEPADMDDDKDIDAIVLNPALGLVQILLNDGGGALSSPAGAPIGFDASSAAVGDFDADGDQDIVIVAADAPGGPRTLRLLRNDLVAGQIGLAPAAAPPVTAEPRLVLAADVDGDADSDIVAIGAEALVRAGMPAESRVIVAASRPACRGDITGDGSIDLADVAAVILHWGEAVMPGAPGDANFDGVVDLADVAEVLLRWGESC